ncbi:hypothetical protein BHE74_00032425 [Ensete ventricosum]|nr:hypothetical protein BHE74_00032425 [Ensete ventricosum]
MNLPNVFGFAEGQPESIVRDIEEMVRSYVEKTTKKEEEKKKEYLAPSSPAYHRRSRVALVPLRPGGDRIYGVFDNQLPAALKKLPFDRHLSLHNVRKVISEADGYQPHLIAPEQGYRRLIDSSLGYFKGPAEASVDAVKFLHSLFLPHYFL